MRLKLVFLIFPLVLLCRVKAEDGDYTSIEDGTQPYEETYKWPGLNWSGLYKITKSFMDCILESIDPKDFIKVTDNKSIELVSHDFGTLLAPFKGFLVFAIILILFALLYPLIGLIYACCRCCGNCGSTPTEKINKIDGRNKFITLIFMLIFWFGFFGCVLFAFGSTVELNLRANHFTEDLKSSIHNLNTYFNNTMQETENLLSTNFKEFRGKTKTLIEGAKNDILSHIALDESCEATIKTAEEFLGHVDEIKSNVNNIIGSATSIGNYGKKLNDGVGEIRTDMEKKCNMEDPPSCDINEIFPKFDFPTDKMPNFNEAENTMKNYDFTSIKKQINDITEKIDTAKNKANNLFDENIKKANKELDKAGQTATDAMENVKETVNDLKNTTVKETDTILDKGDDYIQNYFGYLYGFMLFLCIILLLMVTLMLVGILWSLATKIPEKKGTCLSKAGGSKFFIWVSGLAFALGFFVAVMALVFFSVGFLSDRVICDSVEAPENSKIIQFLNDLIDFTTLGVQFDIVGVMTGCKENNGLYGVFNLTDKFNLDDITKQVDVESIIRPIIKEIEKNTKDLNIIQTDDLNKLDKLITLSLSLDFDSTTLEQPLNELKESIKGIEKIKDLNEFVEPLKNLVNKKIDGGISPEITTITGNITNINTLIDTLKKGVKDLKSDISREQTKLETKIKDISKVTNDFVDNVVKDVNNYIGRVTNKTEQDLGKCQPLYDSTKSILVTGCEKIINPINGFWFSMFLVLLFFVPIIILSNILATLFQKTKPPPFIQEEVMNYHCVNYNGPYDNPALTTEALTYTYGKLEGTNYTYKC